MKKTKVCPRCKKELPIEAYYQINRSDGTSHPSAYCKECTCKMTAESRDGKKKAKAPVAKPEVIASQTPAAPEKPATENHIHKVYYHKDLAKFQPRDLMLELKARGYEGELVYKEYIVKEHRISLGKLN